MYIFFKVRVAKRKRREVKSVDKTMFVISEVQLGSLIEKIQLLADRIENIAIRNEEKVFYTREQVAEHYGISERATAKIFTNLLRDKVIDIGKTQKLAKSHIDKLFENGVKLKG